MTMTMISRICSRSRNIVFAVCMAAMLFGVSALAQSKDTGEGATSGSISELATKLTDDQSAALVRIMRLLAEENQLAQPVGAAESGGLGDIFRRTADSIVHKLDYHIARIPLVFSGVFDAFDRFGSDVKGGFLWFIGLFTIVLAVGAAAHFLVGIYTRSGREKIESSTPESFRDQLQTLGLRFGLELLGLIALIIGSMVTLQIIVSDPASREIMTSLIFTVLVIAWIMSMCLRLVLGPTRPDLRLVAVDNSTATFIYRSLVALALFVGMTIFVLGLLNRYTVPVTDSFRFWIALVAVIWFAFATWRSRNGLTSIIKGNEPNLTPGLERMAAWWPHVSIILLLFIWIYNQFVVGDALRDASPVSAAIALAIVVLAPFLDTMQRGIIRHAMPPMQGEGPVAEAAYDETRLSFVRIGRVLLFAVIIFVLGRLLGISFQNVAEAGLGAQIAANAVQAILVLAIGYVAWEAVNLWANRQLASEMPVEANGETGGEGGGSSQSRIASVLPLVHMTLQITIVVITTLLFLAQLGFDITPLLAGAGVLGLAIGFGAQTLVKDVVSGVFFLLDDAFRVGEFLEIGTTTGSVEKISIRSLQLRGINGPVHIVPYGTVDKLTNHSRDWVIMKLGFIVPFDTDIDKVRKLFKKIGQQIMENPDLAKDIIEPFKSQGVTSVDDVGMTIRGKFMAKPGTQWVLRKEVYTRVQKAFEENGIQFARREVRVQIPGVSGEANLTQEQKEATAAAAAEAALEQDAKAK